MTLTHGVVSSFPSGWKSFLVFCFDKNIDSQYTEVVNNFVIVEIFTINKRKRLYVCLSVADPTAFPTGPIFFEFRPKDQKFSLNDARTFLFFKNIKFDVFWIKKTEFQAIFEEREGGGGRQNP